jgi:hypothetical protein
LVWDNLATEEVFFKHLVDQPLLSLIPVKSVAGSVECGHGAKETP